MSANSSEDSNALDPLTRVRIVLVEPSHPGNIGASARAMKAMGLSDLALVKPREFPAAAATARASGADDILVHAKCYDSLQSAIAACGIVIGTTARERHLEWPVVTPREMAEWLAPRAAQEECALVFGREQAGLSNAEMALCHRMVRIPTSADFSSLNLAQAVQICAYELRNAVVVSPATGARVDEPLATTAELAAALDHLQSVMIKVDFFNPERPRLLPIRLQRLLNRSELKRSEVQILRGFLTAIEETLADH
ncbi:MAG: RNA methyltransferase [Gammaproteobacteria bacterium]|nr:RNA methyltransferase [Gammaproteobacteria bacterium]